MLRGSKPGEHRGGRKRDTPNRRTILTDRILAIGLDHPTLSPHGFLLKLVKDPKLPADTRMAVAPKSFPLKRIHESRTGRPGARGGFPAPAPVSVPREWTPLTLDALFGIVQDATADAKVRRKAALKIAEFLLPKVGKKEKVLPDEYGFSVNPNLASTYRDMQLELRALVNEPTRKIPAIAAKIKKLEARSDAIRRWLQVPCPTKYSYDEAAKDCVRLAEFTRLRYNETVLTAAQKVEEAHLKARFDVFMASPELMARRRRGALEDAERLFKKSRLTGDFYAAPLSRKDRNELELFRWLYPTTPSSRQVEEEIFDEMLRDHPFAEEWPSSDGNFYPLQSKVRPVGVVTYSWSGPDRPTSPPFVSCSVPAADPIQSAEPPQLP